MDNRDRLARLFSVAKKNALHDFSLVAAANRYSNLENNEAATFQPQGYSQLAHMRIRYHFIANLRITETQTILFLTKYDKVNIIG